MSATEGDSVELSLAPQWLRGHGLHSPIGAGSTISGRREAPQLRVDNSRDLSSETPHNHSRTLGLGSRSEERPSAFRSPGKRSSASSSRSYLSNHRSCRATLEDRYHSITTPFSSSSVGAHSSSSGSGPSAASWLSQHAGHVHTLPSAGSAAIPDHQLGQVGAAAANGRAGLQRSVSEGYNTAGSTGSRVFRRLALDAQDFPSLADASTSSSAHSSRRGSSPEPYTPAVAPYKQEFLATRSTSGWTSKLAVVPGSADGEAGSSSRSPLAATTAPVAPGAFAGSKRAGPPSSARVSGPRSTATTVASPEAAAAGSASSPLPSLAETLKQSAASTSIPAAEASKRLSKGLVTMLPSSKAMPGSGTNRTTNARRVDATKGGARVKPLAPPPAIVAPAGGASQPSFVPLGHGSNISSSLGSASAVTGVAVPSKTETGDAGNASSSQVSQQQQQQQQCKMAGSIGSTGASEQQQQLRDRHNFFAVLRRKTSSSSAGSSSGGSGVANAADAGLDMQHASDSRQRTEAHDCAAVDAAAVVARVTSLEDDIHTDDQQHTTSSSAVSAPNKQQQPQLANSYAAGPEQAHCVDQPVSVVSNDNGNSSGAEHSADRSKDASSTPAAANQDPQHSPVKALSPFSNTLQASRQLQSQVSWDLASEEEEEAFLRSLGWTAGSSDDEEEWELTPEEIATFQALAADRAAQQQQQYRVGYTTTLLHSHGAPLSTAPEQKVNNKALAGGMLQTGGPSSVAYSLSCGHQLQQRARAPGAGGDRGLYSVPAAGQGYCGLMLGVYMPQTTNVLDYDSDDSSDDEE